MADFLAITTLGGLRVERDGAAVTRWASRKAAALLVFLACSERNHERERLATLLWDDRPQKRALGNLSVLLSNLRVEIGPYLVADRQTIGLNWSLPLQVDALLFTQELGALVSSGSLKRSSSAQLKRTIDRYAGDFLAGFYVRDAAGFEEWALLEQERLRRQMVEGLDLLVRQSAVRGDLQDGVRYARRLLDLDPLRESTQRDLLRLLALDGQRAAALAQFEACRALLAAELGVEPDEETTALAAAIAADELRAADRPVAISPAQVGAPEHNLPPDATAFIGRGAERRQVADRLANPACRLLTLLGPGGSARRGWRCRRRATSWGATWTASGWSPWRRSRNRLPSCRRLPRPSAWTWAAIPPPPRWPRSWRRARCSWCSTIWSTSFRTRCSPS